VSRYQKGKTNLDFTEARDSEWQWHQLGHMQVYAFLLTNNHVSTPPLNEVGQTIYGIVWKKLVSVSSVGSNNTMPILAHLALPSAVYLDIFSCNWIIDCSLIRVIFNQQYFNYY